MDHSEDTSAATLESTAPAADPTVPEAVAKQRLRLWLKTLRCTTRIENHLRQRLRTHFGITLPQFDLLAALDRAARPMTMSELSKYLLVSKDNPLLKRSSSQKILNPTTSMLILRTYPMIETNKTITFQKAIADNKPMIQEWWSKPHVIKFWDNSRDMWNNIEQYLDSGIVDLFDYWIAYINNIPFALVMTSEIKPFQQDIYGKHACKSGLTFSLDFMIGCEKHLGRGLAPLTLGKFIDFCSPEVKRFIIDPAHHNHRAIHAYYAAGFRKVDTFTPTGGFFSGIKHDLMILDRRNH